MKKISVILLRLAVVAVQVSSAGIAVADEIYLENGDRYSGEITEVTDSQITLKTERVGEIQVERKYVQRVEPAEKVEQMKKAKAPPKLWAVEVAAGYSLSKGNTKASQLDGRFKANRKTEDNELTFKADGTYASQDKKMSTQKYSGMARYAYSFGPEKAWYHFFKGEGEHDRFADIDYRFIPSTGVGYWFSDKPDWKLLTELGAGIEHTRFRSTGDTKTEPVAIPRAFVERKVGKFKFSEDLTSYFYLRDAGEYRLKSESIAEYPFSAKTSGRLSLIDEYSSDPAEGVKKNDMRLVSALVYSF